MNVARTAAEVLAKHTTLELECVDRMYLNVYVPVLQTGAGAALFRDNQDENVATNKMRKPKSRAWGGRA